MKNYRIWEQIGITRLYKSVPYPVCYIGYIRVFPILCVTLLTGNTHRTMAIIETV